MVTRDWQARDLLELRWARLARSHDSSCSVANNNCSLRPTIFSLRAQISKRLPSQSRCLPCAQILSRQPFVVSFYKQTRPNSVTSTDNNTTTHVPCVFCCHQQNHSKRSIQACKSLSLHRTFLVLGKNKRTSTTHLHHKLFLYAFKDGTSSNSFRTLLFHFSIQSTEDLHEFNNTTPCVKQPCLI